MRRFALLLSFVACPVLLAHTPPKNNHDRVIVVGLSPTEVVVDYRLELAEERAAEDLPRDVLVPIRKRRELAEAFLRYFGPRLAQNLVATLDGEELDFTYAGGRWRFGDHLRFDMRFVAAWKLKSGGIHPFRFREANYPLDDISSLRLALLGHHELTLREVKTPSDALMDRPFELRRGKETERLRTASATILVQPSFEPGTVKLGLPPEPDPVRGPGSRRTRAGADKPGGQDGFGREGHPDEEPDEGELSDSKLWHLLLDTRQGMGFLLLLSAGFGAIHALTPGHGKTMVAAYLVGQRGTVWHAILLGVVTTVTHTAAVLVLAALLPLFFPDAVPATVQTVLGLVGGFLIVGLGLWLLMQRLAGRADHVHLGGGHSHGEEAPPGVWGLVVLGISGGIVPCWDAIAMLGFAISTQRLWLGLPLLLAFSAGLAGVLVALGIGVVRAREIVRHRLGEGERLEQALRLLPIVSALILVGLGLWLCYESATLAN